MASPSTTPTYHITHQSAAKQCMHIDINAKVRKVFKSRSHTILCQQGISDS